MMGLYANSPCVKKLVVEQQKIEAFINHPKVLQLPCGICPREVYDNTGVCVCVCVCGVVGCGVYVCVCESVSLYKDVLL